MVMAHNTNAQTCEAAEDCGKVDGALAGLVRFLSLPPSTQ